MLSHNTILLLCIKKGVSMSNTAELVNRFEVHNWTDPKLPFIFHTDRRKAENEALSVGNWHDSLEILCVTEGSGTLYCDGCRYDMKT